MCIPDHVTVQEIQVTLGRGRTRSQHGIVVVYGVRDDILTPVSSEGATFCNKPWVELFQRTGIAESDLWPPESVREWVWLLFCVYTRLLPPSLPQPRNLLHAKLFVVSHTSLEVGVGESLWLLSEQKRDGESLCRWRFSWRISLHDILSQVDCNSEFTKLRYTPPLHAYIHRYIDT